MRPLKRLIQLEEALRISLGKATPIASTESISILESSGRVVAQDILSRVNVPPFSRSAMDGYAVRARDTYGAGKLAPARLRLGEQIYAGTLPKQSVKARSCAEIATGAVLPKGADAVVMVENTEKEDGQILISEAVHPGQNVSKKGEDITPGTRIVSRGDLLNPSKIGAIAALGLSEVLVFKKPLVAVVATGNEIAELGGDLKPGQVYNINSYTLSSAVAANGGDPRVLKIANDNVDDLLRVIANNSDCDIIVFSGGSSVGERDVILDAIEREGSVLFHGIAVKPGKPTIFGVVRSQLIFGMPGYPTACLSNAYILLAPVLRRMARLPEQAPTSINAKMAKRVVSTTGRTQFLTVRLEKGLAYPAFKESGAITSMAFADGYIIIPSDVDLIEKGEPVTVYLL